MRHSDSGKNYQGRSSDRYVQELILWVQFSYFLYYLEKHRNPSWWWLFLMTSKSFMGPAETFWKNMCLIFACTLPVPKSHIYYSPLHLSQTVSQDYLRCYLQRLPWKRAQQPTPLLLLENPWTEEPGWLLSPVSQRSRTRAEQLSMHSSRVTILILPQIKLNVQLSCCLFFKSTAY